MSAASKALYLPLSVASSVAGGLIAGRIFTEIWQRISPSDQEPPDPKDLDRSGREAITAAALPGAGVRSRAGRGRPGQRQGLQGRHAREPEVASPISA
jgi:hypothetical protein